MSELAKASESALPQDSAGSAGGGMKSADDLFGDDQLTFRGDYYFLNTKEARDRFSRLISKVSDGKQVVITHHGEPRAVLIPVEDFRTLDALAAVGVKDDLDAIASEEMSVEELEAKLCAVLVEKAASHGKKNK